MRIINYDADKNDALKCLSFEPFVLDVVRHIETQSLDPRMMVSEYDDTVNPTFEMFNSPIRFFEHPKYENIAKLIHTIPICLCSSRKLVESARQEGHDVLGSYCYWDIKYQTVNLSPFIVLYPGEIFNCAEEYKKTYGERVYKWLFAQILLHELGHAAMDLRNCMYFYDCKDCISDWKPRTVIEESMANAISLRIIRKYRGSKDFEEFFYFVRGFCQRKQPFEYALGVNLEESEEGINDIIDKYLEAKNLDVSDEEIAEWKEYLLNIAGYTLGDKIEHFFK